MIKFINSEEDIKKVASEHLSGWDCDAYKSMRFMDENPPKRIVCFFNRIPVLGEDKFDQFLWDPNKKIYEKR